MKRFPVKMLPIAKDYLWGGKRLNEMYNLDIDAYPLAELWMCSTHPDGVSYVPAFSMSLSDLLNKNPDWLGNRVLEITDGRAELPILVKLIDAEQKLSVQVHPNDEYARRIENQSGKSEMWYILDATPCSRLVYGFKCDVDVQTVTEAISNGSIEELLNYVPVNQNDVFFIESGTVHAIGEGIVLAEIQQSSNVTYRLYDYDRIDKNGKRRELHIEKALEVANMNSSEFFSQKNGVSKCGLGYTTKLLTKCEFFQVEKIALETTDTKPVKYSTAKDSFHIFLVIEGHGTILEHSASEDPLRLEVVKGDCIFLPADSIPLCMFGHAQLLNVSC